MSLEKEQLHNTLSDHPKKIVSLETVLSPRDHREGHVTVQTFDVQITDPEGKQLGTYPLEIGYQKNQDVVDTIVYSVDKEQGEVTIYTETSLRPVLKTRRQLEVDDADTERLTEGLYTILSPELGDISFSDAVKRVLGDKAGYSLPDDAVLDLQSSYFPSIGGSSEVAIGCYVDVTHTKKPEKQIFFGERFAAERSIEPVSIHKIVHDFIAGKTSDLRLVLHAFALAKKYDISVRISPQDPVMVGRAQTKNHTIPVGMHEICGQDAEQVLQDVLAKQDAYTITLQKKETAPQFIQAQRAEVIQTRQDGTQDAYEADMMVRNGVDTIDALPYFWSKGKLYVVAKVGVRPTLIARDYLPHYISLSETLANIELYSGAKDIQQLPSDQVHNLLNKKLGSFDANSKHIGSFFPSSGNNPEKTDLFVCELNTEKEAEMSGWKEFDCVDTPVLAIEMESLFQLFEKNIIKDPRLMLGAYVLQQKYAYANVADRPIATIGVKEKHRFQEVINAPLQVDNFYKYIATQLNDPAIYDRHVLFKEKSPWYRKVMSYVEEELGGFFSPEDQLLSETDKHFFDAAFPMFAVPSIELALKYQNYAAHDMGHYVQGTIVPRPDMPRETYVKLMSKSESYAVYDSDYRYPKELGLDRFEPTIGNNKSLARSFDNLGISDADEVRCIVTQIEVEGVIPEKILRHPNYAEERVNIVYRIYRFHFLDKIHSEHQYDQRMENQKIADVLLRFGNCVSSEEEFEQRIDQYDKKTVKNHGEGVNPLKSFLKRITTQDIQMLAMKVAVILQMFSDNGLEDPHPHMVYIHQLLDQLEHYKTIIDQMHAAITGIETNEKNVKCVRDADAIKAQIVQLKSRLMDDFMKRDCLSVDQKNILQHNTVPYFTGFSDIPAAELTKMIEEGERKQIENLL